jgi:hypothetical protein
MKVKTTGQAEPEVVARDVLNGAAVPVWSPSGEWILSNDRGMTKLFAADGQQTRHLNIDGLCAFALDAEFLYCLQAPRPDGSRSLVTVDFNGSTLREIGSIAPEHAPRAPIVPSLRLTWTPDRKGLTYSTGTNSTNLWLVDGLDTVPPP